MREHHSNPLGVLALIDSHLPAGPFTDARWSVQAPGAGMARYTAHLTTNGDACCGTPLVDPTRRNLEFADALLVCQVCFDDDYRDQWRLAIGTWVVGFDVTEHLADLTDQLHRLLGETDQPWEITNILEDLRCLGLYLSDTPVDWHRHAGDTDLPWTPAHLAARDAVGDVHGDAATVLADAIAMLDQARAAWDTIIDSGAVNAFVDANPLRVDTDVEPDPVWVVLWRNSWADAADELADPGDLLATVFTLATRPAAITDQTAVYATTRRTLSVLNLAQSGGTLAPIRDGVTGDQLAAAAGLYERSPNIGFGDLLDALIVAGGR